MFVCNGFGLLQLRDKPIRILGVSDRDAEMPIGFTSLSLLKVFLSFPLIKAGGFHFRADTDLKYYQGIFQHFHSFTIIKFKSLLNYLLVVMFTWKLQKRWMALKCQTLFLDLFQSVFSYPVKPLGHEGQTTLYQQQSYLTQKVVVYR